MPLALPVQILPAISGNGRRTGGKQAIARRHDFGGLPKLAVSASDR
jgi:hypothetical protein